MKAVIVILRISREIIIKYFRNIKNERFKYKIKFYRLLNS